MRVGQSKRDLLQRCWAVGLAVAPLYQTQFGVAALLAAPNEHQTFGLVTVRLSAVFRR
jgi:hypothetical protein